MAIYGFNRIEFEPFKTDKKILTLLEGEYINFESFSLVAGAGFEPTTFGL